MNHRKHQHAQHGFSLIEIMIALIIGFILTGGAIQIFISSKATYKLESALTRLQETGRYIVDTVAKEVRMAGYTGCSSRGNISVNVIANSPPPLTIGDSNSILGYNGGAGWTPAIPANLLLAMNNVTPGTDVINVQRADECGAAIVGNWDVTNANVQVAFPNSCGFVQNMPVIVSNCTNADVFQIVNAPTVNGNKQTLTHSNAGNTGNFLSKNYGPDSQISKPRSNIFFIAPGSSGEPALYLASWNPTDGNAALTAADFTVLELADGAEDMQIQYGEDTGGGNEYADTYVDADAVADWTKVRSVRVNFLLRSADRVTDQPRSITFMGNAVNAGAGADRRLRMVFTSTITIRNRLQ